MPHNADAHGFEVGTYVAPTNPGSTYAGYATFLTIVHPEFAYLKGRFGNGRCVVAGEPYKILGKGLHESMDAMIYVLESSSRQVYLYSGSHPGNMHIYNDPEFEGWDNNV